jgi:hypothetical protein
MRPWQLRLTRTTTTSLRLTRMKTQRKRLAAAVACHGKAGRAAEVVQGLVRCGVWRLNRCLLCLWTQDTVNDQPGPASPAASVSGSDDFEDLDAFAEESCKQLEHAETAQARSAPPGAHAARDRWTHCLHGMQRCMYRFVR